MRNIVLVLKEVYKTYSHLGESIEVLRGVSVAIARGQSLAIMGASGVGKSTLLHIMGSLEPPSKGTILFGGRKVSDMDESALCRLRNREIGFVFQFHHLLPEFNALENTMMPALIARYPVKKARSLAEEVLHHVGLEKRMSHRIGEMSGGEQQRVAIARALIMKPGLILADEPTGNLDWKTGEEVAELLEKLNREIGMAMVVATHNQRLASRMSAQMEIIGGELV
ncbi:MAG TPA: ABC transporter ATP-binding protein [Desulfobacteraceae bacterium]|nr:MAG: ABC transporter ATP-binding protein [Desulfobacteraceae bacterium 4484_190.3]RLB18805.1 MAG: ABC transporter ATP-binding protein [Deltaproteobacteria bacterium]HDZ24383.1 ABC transporter ATP-binding protein [Desulfobacteraceae bacterium]